VPARYERVFCDNISVWNPARAFTTTPSGQISSVTLKLYAAAHKSAYFVSTTIAPAWRTLLLVLAQIMPPQSMVQRRQNE